MVQEANGYHVEMVKVKETLNFYLLGADGKASKKAATGKVEFKFANKTKSTSSLSAGKNGALHTALPKANIFEYCTAILTVDGKTVKARFKNTVSEAAKAHGHEH